MSAVVSGPANASAPANSQESTTTTTQNVPWKKSQISQDKTHQQTANVPQDYEKWNQEMNAWLAKVPQDWGSDPIQRLDGLIPILKKGKYWDLAWTKEEKKLQLQKMTKPNFQKYNNGAVLDTFLDFIIGLEFSLATAIGQKKALDAENTKLKTEKATLEAENNRLLTEYGKALEETAKAKNALYEQATDEITKLTNRLSIADQRPSVDTKLAAKLNDGESVQDRVDYFKGAFGIKRHSTQTNLLDVKKRIRTAEHKVDEAKSNLEQAEEKLIYETVELHALRVIEADFIQMQAGVEQNNIDVRNDRVKKVQARVEEKEHTNNLKKQKTAIYSNYYGQLKPKVPKNSNANQNPQAMAPNVQATSGPQIQSGPPGMNGNQNPQFVVVGPNVQAYSGPQMQSGPQFVHQGTYVMSGPQVLPAGAQIMQVPQTQAPAFAWNSMMPMMAGAQLIEVPHTQVPQTQVPLAPNGLPTFTPDDFENGSEKPMEEC